MIADVAAVHDLIAEDHPGLPVIVFGHSMGGLIALNFMLRHPERVAGAAIWNANFSAGLAGRVAQAILAWEHFRLGSDVPSRLLPALTFQAWAKQVPNRRTASTGCRAIRPRSTNTSPTRSAAGTPRFRCGGTCSASSLPAPTTATFQPFARNLPFNLVGGEKDPASNGGKAVTDLAGRLTRMGFSNFVSKVYPETRHESLNEVNRDTIIDDFAEWADCNVFRT